MVGFNPRARAGRDQLAKRGHKVDTVFQSTRPCGARLNIRSPQCSKYEFQSTRPCGARLLDLDNLLVARQVSIHAPVRGATISLTARAPRRNSSFNPRARAGRDIQ